MRIHRSVLLAVLAAASSVAVCSAQSPTPAPVPQPQWSPQGVEGLGLNSSSRTEFSFGHSMLVLASKLDQDNDSLRRVVAGVSGVSVHIFRFPRGGGYDPGAVHELGEEYHAAGWQHLVDNHAKDGGPGATDLWIHFENAAVSDVAVLLAKENQLDFITISGSIAPLDLLRIGGHFGIPKMEGGVLVPAPDDRRR